MMRSSKTLRRGFAIAEALAAIALVALAAIATAQVLVVCARQRLVGEQRLAAQLEAANVQERIATLPYEAISPSTLESLRLLPTTQAVLPHASLHIDLADSKSDEPRSKQIRVEVSWPQFAASDGTESASDVPPLRVELTAWRFPTAGEAAP
jgi:hypothetical protein